MSAKRWATQDAYADAIEAAADSNDVPRSLAYALIAQESGFNPNAIRNEPTYHCAATGQTGDASYGLTQVLYCTARALGYPGTPTGLFDVQTNLQLGLMLLGGLLTSHGGDVAAALSAYNGGDRHSLGYGARRADGTFANQTYVNNILNNAAYFDTYLSDRDGTDAGDSSAIATDDTPPSSSNAGDVAGLIVLLAAMGLGGLAVARS